MLLHNATHHVVRIDRGCEVIQCLTNFAHSHNITTATLSAIGATNNAIVGAFDTDTHQYHSHHYTDKMEILNLTGNITTKDNAPYIHVHAMLGMPNGSVVGGHLNSCVVSATCEMFIISYSNSIDRQFDEQVGLNLMVTDNE